MKDLYKQILRIALTVIIVVVAVMLGHILWVRYMDSPWTRDGRVRADVVNIASDVSGLVTEVVVRDNQFVKKGDLLFRIDAERYHHAVEEAEAKLEQRKITLALKRGQSTRRAMLDDQVISREDREDSDLISLAAKADLDQAHAELGHARLNLKRTEVRAPVDGWVSNLLVRPGDYAQAGQPKLALIDQKSYWVYGYFEEHKLPLIHVNDPAEIRMLGTDVVLRGHVESMARGITDRDNPTDVRLLANVNPSFNWVRLAQRVPVRIHIDEIPDGVVLVAGMTCSVIIHPAAPKTANTSPPA